MSAFGAKRTWTVVRPTPLQTAARTLGLQIHVLPASTDRDFDSVFATLVQLRAGGLVISSDSFLYSRSEQLAALAARHAVPAIYPFREWFGCGRLISTIRWSTLL